MKIATGQGITSKNVQNEILNYTQLKRKIASFEIVEQIYSNKATGENGQPITLNPKDALIETLKTAKNKLPWFIAGYFKPKIRRTKNLFSRSLIVLDVDHYQYDLNTLEIDLKQDLGQYKYLAYSTASHTPTKPKIRIVIFLKESIATENYSSVTKNLVNSLPSFKGIGLDKEPIIDEASYKPNQFMFFSGILKITNLPPEITLEEYEPWVGENNKGQLLNPSDFKENHNLVKSFIDLPKDCNSSSVSASPIKVDLSDTEIQECLAQYAVKKLSYDKWIEVGMTLHHHHNGSEEGLKIWDTWSLNDIRYKEGETKSKWNSFDYDHANPKTLKSVLRDIGIAYEEPEPLRKTKSIAVDFPIDSLPSSLKEAILALHDKLQAPIALCAQSILAATNLAVQGHADVMLPIGQSRPISCYFLSVAESGERKSSCDNEALSSIKTHENKLKEQYNLDIKQWQNANDAYVAERQSILKKNKSDLFARTVSLNVLGEQPTKPLTPLIICPEPTFEGLCKLMQDGHPSLGIFSAEGGQFIAGHGMKEENKIRTATALSSVWDGEDIKRVRAGDGISILSGRRLSMHLMVQHNIATTFLSDTVLQDQGLLSRFLVTAPVSTIGTRMKREVKTKSEENLKQFCAKLSEILNTKLSLKINCINELEPRKVTLSIDAIDQYHDYADQVESLMGASGKFESIRGFANKLPEHALRLAVTMALFDDINIGVLNKSYLEKAIALTDFYASEALRLRDDGMIDSKILIAEKLLTWIKDKWKGDSISLPDIYQGSINAIKTKVKALEIVTVLENHGYLRKNNIPMIINDKNRKDTWKIVKLNK